MGGTGGIDFLVLTSPPDDLYLYSTSIRGSETGCKSMLRSLHQSSVRRIGSTVGIHVNRFSTSISTRSGGPLTEVCHYPYFFDKVALPSTSAGVVAGGRGGSGVEEEYTRIPAFRVLDSEGKVVPGLQGEWKTALESIDPETLVKIYKTMILLPSMVRFRLDLRESGEADKVDHVVSLL